MILVVGSSYTMTNFQYDMVLGRFLNYTTNVSNTLDVLTQFSFSLWILSK